jgi:hypothetical protein
MHALHHADKHACACRHNSGIGATANNIVLEWTDSIGSSSESSSPSMCPSKLPLSARGLDRAVSLTSQFKVASRIRDQPAARQGRLPGRLVFLTDSVSTSDSTRLAFSYNDGLAVATMLTA